jgi:hypothetical protein
MKDRIDWAVLLRSEAVTRPFVRADEFASRQHIPYSSVLSALNRQAKRGLVEHVFRNIYLNRLAAGFDPRDLVNVIRPNSYVSLDSALAECGISTQSPIRLTCVSTSYALTIKRPSVFIDYRKISEELFWGFVDRKTRYGTYRIAEPEKALLDWVYFRINDSLPIQLDELQFQNINPSRLYQYARKYPRSAVDSLMPTLIDKRLCGDVPSSQSDA